MSEGTDQVKSVTLTPQKRFYGQKNRETPHEEHTLNRDNSSKRVYQQPQTFNPLMNYDKPSGMPSYTLVSQFEKPVVNHPQSYIARSPSRERQMRQLQKSCSQQIRECFQTPQYIN